MIDRIRAKLQEALLKDIMDEVQALYILALTRKILEAHKLKQKFPNLNFFCNWAVHYYIDDVRLIEEDLNGIIQGHENRFQKLMDFINNFCYQFKDFLEVEKFSSNKYSSREQIANFRNHALNVCAYSPLIVDTPGREKPVKVFLEQTERIPGMPSSFIWSITSKDLEEEEIKDLEGRRRSRRRR